MNTFNPFVMERWQSTFENRVDFNLSESGVDPLSLAELLELGGAAADVHATKLGYGQSNGTDALRARIAALYTDASEDAVVVCNGSAEANFLAMWHLVGAGDDVVVITPTYMQTHGLARNAGARVHEVPLREELGWQPDPDEVRHVVTGSTRMIVVTNPGNPTGMMLNDAARRAIIAAAEHTGAWILADEVYSGAELNGTETASFFGTHERVIATGSLSKAYGLPGLRVGWCTTDVRTAEAIWARSDYTTISTGDLTDRLARIALDPAVRPQLLSRTRSLIDAGLDLLTRWLHDTGGFHWQRPDAGAICLARYDDAIDSGQLAERLRVEQSVLVVPGTHFGLGPYLRFGTGAPGPAMQQALDRIGQTLDAMRQVA